MTRCAVVGLGVLGGAALLALSRAGVECVGLESGTVGHPDGASGGGETRIFRTAVADGAPYERLLDRSRELWADLAAGHGPGLFTPCGALTLGPPDDARLRSVALSGRTEPFRAEAVAERWPGHRPGPGELGLFDPRGGVLDAAGCTRALVAEARRGGAVVREGVRVLGIGYRRGQVVLRTVDGETVADAAVLATGHERPLLDGPARVEQRRVVLSWFPVAGPGRFGPETFPPGVHSGSDPVFTFFPSVDHATIKINFQQPQPPVTDARTHHPTVTPGYADPWSNAVAARIDGMAALPVRTESYVEGYTADRHGVVALAPASPRVVTLGGFSGQGFKYAPAVGEIVADLVRTGRARTAAFAAAHTLAG
ncbi:FAD-dependent oxidoreductase [Pseudonocardia nematodicida]|uniref:FAD-dependent oxidoreductase n=1 Tax=Pseudonocardia nematodicida TaxID=1206997 RepID=A0ABV1K6G9_9PSEU